MTPHEQPVASRPAVSVVIPAYNYAGYLPDAIESVLKQEFTDYELIVVDDGSTDNTAEVVGKYGQKIRYIHQKNAGLPSARNTGIKAARGEFVAFLDADDQWMPCFLKEAMAHFARLPKDFGVVASRNSFVDQHGNPMNLKRIVAEVDEEFSIRDLISKTRFFPSAVVARRSALEASGYFNPTLRSSEDRDMWIRLALKHRVFLHKHRLVLIRRHSNSMSKNADRMKENIAKVLRNAYENEYVPRSAVGFWLHVLGFYYFQTAWMFYEEGRRGAAIVDLLKSICCWPVFLTAQPVNEPALFRLRSLMRFAFR